jgi:putative nucleotidyltransferase with HDIG domain
MTDKDSLADAGTVSDRRRRMSAVALSAGILILLAVYTLVLFMFPSLEAFVSYRIIVLTTVIVSLVALHVAGTHQRRGRQESAQDAARQRMGLQTEIWITVTGLGFLAVFVVASLIWPSILNVFSLRILTLSVALAVLTCFYGVEKTIRRKGIAGRFDATGLGRGGLGRRFIASLLVFLLLPVYIVLLYFYPFLQSIAEMRIIMLAIVTGALIGFWSVGRDIFELLRIMQKARLIARREVREVIAASRPGEIQELAEAFNIVIADLDRAVEELRLAKDRVELLVRRIGTAVSATGNTEELIKLLLDISTDSLHAHRGVLHIRRSPVSEERTEIITRSEDGVAILRADCREKVIQVAETGQSIIEARFLAAPLRRGEKTLGTLALERADADSPFAAGDGEMLQSLADQSALAVEATQLRASDERIYFETVSALALAIEARDPYTRGHSQHVSQVAAAMAKFMGMSTEEVEIVRDSALLHDIGKIGVPDAVLRKEAPLTAAEFDIIKRHSVIGEYILRPARSLHLLLPSIRQHHERVDGKGYPDGLKGGEANGIALIISVADSFDAMLSNRPYRQAYSLSKAIEEIRRNIGTQFDPQAANALISLIETGTLDLAQLKA